MPTLNLSLQALAYTDSQPNNNQMRRLIDWKRPLQGLDVDLPHSTTTVLQPLQEKVIFSTLVALTINSSSQFSIIASPLGDGRYRLAFTGTGAAPNFRTDRNLTLAGGNVTITLNTNQTVTVTHSAGAVFGAVVVGDNVFIPGINTGDPHLFDPMNEGEWNVLAATATTLTLSRATGSIFTGVSETVPVTLNSQFLAYSSAGLQVGDTFDISAGFSPSTTGSYIAAAVTSTFVEFISTVPVAIETAVPGVAGLIAYSGSKRFVCIETDQSVAIKSNGNTAETERLDPIAPANDDLTGIYVKWGTCYSLSIKNRSTEKANVVILTAG